MASTTITCPHCGAETEDPEYCRVCGEVLLDLPAEKKIEQFSIKEEVLFYEMIERLFSFFKPCAGKKPCVSYNEHLWDDLDCLPVARDLFDHEEDDYKDHGINPVNGLPMIDESVDIEGNLFGTDSDNNDWISDDNDGMIAFDTDFDDNNSLS